MIYREIDSNGYYIKDVEFEINTDDTKYILENYGNMRKPKWDGSMWIDENPIDEFQEVKENKINEITEIANNIVLSKYSALKQRKSMTIMLKLFNKGKENWDTTDTNTYTTLQKIDVWITDIRTQENNKISEVTAMTNIADIKNYNIEFIR